MDSRLSRSEVAIESTWDLSDLFASDEEFYASMDTLEDELKTVTIFKGKLTESGSSLYEGILALENLIVKLYSLGTYASLKQSSDARNIDHQKMQMKFATVSTAIEAEITFYEDEITALSQEAYQALYKEDKRLELYRPYLDETYDNKQYQLSDETEAALAALGEVMGAPYRTYAMSKATDMQFDPAKDKDGVDHENSFALFEGKYEFSDDPVLRKNAYESFNKTLKQYMNTYASIYGTEVKKQIAMSRLRGYDSVTDMLLKSQKVTKEMYNRQIDVIYKGLAPHMRKFAGLIKKELGLDLVHFYDLKAPIDTTYNPKADYNEVKEIIKKALSVMGDEYSQIIDTALNNRWIDYADNIGKSTGAFCASPYASHSYILVTFQNNMRDAFTLAHELGHAAHFTMANREQKYFNTRPSRYTIEAPSTMNEMLLGRYLMKEYDDPKMKKWVILQFLGTYYHNFVTHLLEAAYQRKVYEYAESGQGITGSQLCQFKLEVLRGFWGDAVEIDDDAGMTWMRQPHYYMGLYPYTYSAGLTASTACSAMIFEEGQPAVERWINMLKMGGKLKPLDLLKVAGMDLSTDEPVEKAVAYVGSLIDELIELC